MSENNFWGRHMKNYGDIDIFWNEKGWFELGSIDNVTIITQGEGGFTTMLMGNAVVENDNCEKIGTILSKYHTVDAFNIIPKTADIGWPIYRINNTMIIRITSWYPLVFAPNANPSAWIYSYPIIKSLVEFIKNLEVRNIEYVCSGEQMSELKDSKSFMTKSKGRWARVIPSWADQDEEPTDIFASTPSWAIPYISKIMGVPCNVSCIINQDESIDDQKQTAIDFYRWFNKFISHWDIDVTKKGIGQKTIEKNVKELKELQSELKLNKPIYKKPDEGVMFG